VTSDTQRPRTRLTAPERKQAILDAAMKVFSRGGYHGSSIDQIAQAAGISKALIYDHFPSKRELHGSLLEAHVGELFGRLAASAQMGGEPEARLRRGLDTFFSFVEERREAWRMLFRDAVDPDVADQFRRVQAQATGLIAALMESDPDMPPTDDPEEHLVVEMLAQQLSGAMQSLANWWFDHQHVRRAQLVDIAVTFAWNGLERVRESRLSARAARPAA
jgi:AcrR family transcriptional regulator